MNEKAKKIRRSIDFDPDVYKRLQKNARENERSVQYMITYIIGEYLKKPKTTSKRPIKFF